MLGSIFNTVQTLLEGVETIAEKSVKITDKSLDIIDIEVDTSVRASKATQDSKVQLAIAAANYDLQKAELKLSLKMSALEKLAAEHTTEKKD